MWVSLVIQALKWLIDSSLMEDVIALVSEAEKLDEPGVSKWSWVWSQIRGDERVMSTVQKYGKYMVNLAIEAAVAYIRK